ncbi:MAG: c-type cytochrome, partial [Saprospiraceae bacterium]
MKSKHMMIYKYLNISKLLVLGLILTSFSLAAEVSPDAGKKLFKDYCGTCHAKNMKSAGTGPALAGAQEKWDNDADLYAWIRNSQASIAAGQPRATELWAQYKPTIMTSFPNLTDDEIGSILAYVNGVSDGTYGGKKVVPDSQVSNAPVEKKPNWWLYGSLLAGLAFLSLLLMKIISNLNIVDAAKNGEILEPKSLYQQLSSKGIIGILIFALVIFAGYTTVNNAVNLGRQQGYAPEQPIKFSHETHAGIHKIECQYCHDGARRSKHSIIPAANTCMNCHKAITNGSTYGTAELTKIYASVGFNPNTNKYIENYENMGIDDAKEIYGKWIGDQYIVDNELADLDEDGKEVVVEQLDGIVASLTNPLKKDKLYGPIEWVRIHNLPDHVYFNHAQHVTVGEIECQ